MPEIIDCPQCERKLRVPDDLLGRAVKCPTCGVTFTAPAAAASAFAGAAEHAPPETYQQDDSRSTSASGVPDQYPPREDEEAPWPSRRRRVDLPPHRGTLILVLGILSIVLCGF